MSSYDGVIVNECPILPGAQSLRNPLPGWKEIKMPKTKIAVQVVSAGHLEGDTIMLGETYVKQWKIPNGQPVTLRFGSYRGHVKVIAASRYDGIRISQALAKRMGIHSHVTLRLQYRSSASQLTL